MTWEGARQQVEEGQRALLETAREANSKKQGPNTCACFHTIQELTTCGGSLLAQLENPTMSLRRDKEQEGGWGARDAANQGLPSCYTCAVQLLFCCASQRLHSEHASAALVLHSNRAAFPLRKLKLTQRTQ